MTAPDQTNAEVSDERLREPNLYAEIIAIVNDCSERMKRRGESHRMFAKWVSEGVNALLNRHSVTSQASEGEVVAWEWWSAGRPDIKRVQHSKPGLVPNRQMRPLYASPSKRVERLETALKPFADAAADLPEHIHDMLPVVLTTDAEDNPADIVHIGDFRRALQALGDRS